MPLMFPERPASQGVPSPAYTVYGWIRREAHAFVAVVLASAAPPYAGREVYERRWLTEHDACAELPWMARALAARVEKRGGAVAAVELLDAPPAP